MCVNVWQLWITLQPSTTPLSCGFMVTQDHSSSEPQHSRDTASRTAPHHSISSLNVLCSCPTKSLALSLPLLPSFLYSNSALVKYNSSLNTDITQRITKITISIYRRKSADVRHWQSATQIASLSRQQMADGHYSHRARPQVADEGRHLIKVQRMASQSNVIKVNSACHSCGQTVFRISIYTDKTMNVIKQSSIMVTNYRALETIMCRK